MQRALSCCGQSSPVALLPLAHVHTLSEHSASVVAVAAFDWYCAAVHCLMPLHEPANVSVGVSFMYCEWSHTVTAAHTRLALALGASLWKVTLRLHSRHTAHASTRCPDEPSHVPAAHDWHVCCAVLLSAEMDWPAAHVGCGVQTSSW